MMKSTTITFNQEDLQLLALAEVEKMVHPLPAEKVTYEWDSFGELAVHVIEEISVAKDAGLSEEEQPEIRDAMRSPFIADTQDFKP